MKPVRNEVFTSLSEQRFLKWYHRIFSIEEIENKSILQWVFGATILSHFAAFNVWLYRYATTTDAFNAKTHLCWPYFQNCGEYLFLRTLPEGYSQPFLYMVLFATLVLSVYLIYRRDWLLAHMFLLPSFVWHTLGTFVITAGLAGNFEYYVFILTFVLLFVPHKEFFLKVSLALFYFLAATGKIHEGWILGTYFSSLQIGLPLFPKWSIPIWTNLVILMQIVGVWLLFSKHLILQRFFVAYFTIFHIYSGLIVGYHYPITVLPTLLILFGPMYTYTSVPFDKKAIIGWCMVALLFPLQFISIFIPGDEKLTLEGNNYGLYMFEANHQCISKATVVRTDGTKESATTVSNSARNRCNPYKYWFALKQRCDAYPDIISGIEWTFDHSVNGGPFLRIVDTEDACALTYKAFSHNEWIKTDQDDPQVVGYPRENQYR